MEETLIGKIIHHYAKIGVGVVKITKGSLKVGDKIHIKGNTTDFEQNVASMQVEHEDIQEAKKGKEAGLKVDDKVKEGDLVYKVVE